MGSFDGTLFSNEIFSSLFNMIISQEVFADNIAGTFGSLVDRSRVEGTLYGDTKLYYSPDVLQSYAWGNDAEAANLLEINRPEAPECQAITINVFRQIRLTVDNYLSKRAWSTAHAFGTFNSVMLGMIRETKKIPRDERSELCRSVHAEANAIISTSRDKMLGSTLYLVGIECDTGEYVENASSCSMCKRLIINAGIQHVIIRDNKDDYRIIHVQKWIEEDESLDGMRGY